MKLISWNEMHDEIRAYAARVRYSKYEIRGTREAQISSDFYTFSLLSRLALDSESLFFMRPRRERTFVITICVCRFVTYRLL